MNGKVCSPYCNEPTRYKNAFINTFLVLLLLLLLLSLLLLLLLLLLYYHYYCYVSQEWKSAHA